MAIQSKYRLAHRLLSFAFTGCCLLTAPTSVGAQPQPTAPLTVQEPLATELPLTGDPAPARYTIREVVRGSVFGVENDTREWTPLYPFRNIREGWMEPWLATPAATGDAPRDGWLNTLDGFFPRSVNILYAHTDGPTGRRATTDYATFQLVTPLSRRLFLGIDGPSLVSSNSTPGDPAQTRLADVVFTPRVMLYDNRDLAVSVGLGVRLPTGSEDLGQGQTRLIPSLAFWSAVGGGWSVRGGIGVDSELHSRQPGTVTVRQAPGGSGDVTFAASGAPNNILFTNLAIGQTLTSKEQTPFGSFTYYLSANTRTDLSNSKTFVSLTPGMRSHVGHNVYLLFAYEIPVTGPRPFNQRFLFQFVRAF